MKIAYLGNFRPTHSTETHVAASFEELGHDVIRIQEDKYNSDEILDMSRNADFFLWTKTWGVIGDAMKMLKSLKIPTVSYHLDLYVGLERQKDIDNSPFWKTDYVFTPDGGHDKFFKDRGINHHFMKAGVYGKECFIGDKRKEFEYDVIFVGSKSYHREWTHRQNLIHFLEKTFGDSFRLFPNDDFKCVRGKDLNDLYASAKVVVGDSLYSPYYWSDRIYETTGRGGFIIHPIIAGLSDEFEYGEDIVGYRHTNFDRLERVINHYLKHEKERESIRMNGHEKTKNNYTYVHRCKQILETIK